MAGRGNSGVSSLAVNRTVVVRARLRLIRRRSKGARLTSRQDLDLDGLGGCEMIRAEDLLLR